MLIYQSVQNKCFLLKVKFFIVCHEIQNYLKKLEEFKSVLLKDICDLEDWGTLKYSNLFNMPMKERSRKVNQMSQGQIAINQARGHHDPDL